MMLHTPSTVENNDKGVGMQVWKVEEMLIKKELVGVQCCGSADEILAGSQDMVRELPVNHRLMAPSRILPNIYNDTDGDIAIGSLGNFREDELSHR